MSEEVRVNRPQPQMQQTHSMSGEMPSQKGGSKMPWVVLAFVVIILIIVGVLFRGSLFKKTMSKTASMGGAEYQAVFLTNGQVYFGKISNTTGDYVTLDNIYYLQVGPAQGSGAASTSTPQNISLVKLGNELHGPVDEMHINRGQILFYEDLKSDGQVVKAIQAYKDTPTPTK